jgi:hypothetical protein
VVVGRLAVKELTGRDWLAAWPHDFVLPKWPDDDRSSLSVVDELCASVQGLERSDKPQARGLLGPPYYRMTKGNEYVARVFVVDTEVCTSEVCSTGARYGTSDLVLHLLYSEILRAKSHTSERQALADAIDAVTASQAVSSCEGVHRRFTPFNLRNHDPLLPGDEISDSAPKAPIASGSIRV